MRFQRRPLIMPKGVNNRRLFFARRRIQRHNDSWALFPEFQTTRRPEDDILEIDRKSIECQMRDRVRRAAAWRAVRKQLQGLPGREEILAYWRTCGYPGEPERLQAIIDRGADWLHERQAELDRARIMGQIMDQAMRDTEPQQVWESYKGAFFRRLSIARQRAEQLRPDLFQRRAA